MVNPSDDRGSLLITLEPEAAVTTALLVKEAGLGAAAGAGRAVVAGSASSGLLADGGEAAGWWASP
jgi:hypothetical protein